MISVVIAKSTRICNADCSYCCAPPYDREKWTIEDFESFIKKMAPWLGTSVQWIWHGGEPMLMGTDFFYRAREIAERIVPGQIEFSMQSNLLAYDSKKWKNVFQDVLGGRVSTSYDPDELYRTVNGDPVKYNALFWNAVSRMKEDGFRIMAIATFRKETAGLAIPFYERNLAFGKDAMHLRLNYMRPDGRIAGTGKLIDPVEYGQMLVDVYDRWVSDAPCFAVTPLIYALRSSLGFGWGECPWTSHCGGKFLGLEPNGDVYNCSEFADLGSDWKFGNLHEDSMEKMMSSGPALFAQTRMFRIPEECVTCEHYAECDAGCGRDVVLYQAMDGKFPYCASWKAIFSRVKKSIASGEANNLIEAMKNFIDRGDRRTGLGERPGTENLVQLH